MCGTVNRVAIRVRRQDDNTGGVSKGGEGHDQMRTPYKWLRIALEIALYRYFQRPKER